MNSNLHTFLLGNLVKLEQAIDEHKEHLKAILQSIAEGKRMTVEDIESGTNISNEDYNNLSILVSKGIPLYHALLANIHKSEKDKFKKINRNPLVNKTELARFFFADMVLIMTQGRSIAEENVYIPSILIKSYGYVHNSDSVKKYLYGNSFSKFNVETLYALASALNFGKIGNRLGLGIAGTRYIQASLMMYCPDIEEEKIKNALAILRALNTIENKEILHSLKRTKEFTNVFGSINHVFFYIYTQYCDEVYKDFLKKNKSVYGKLTPGSQFMSYLKWDKNTIANYIFGTVSENIIRKNEFLEKVEEELVKVLEKPFLIREKETEQFSSGNQGEEEEGREIET